LLAVSSRAAGHYDYLRTVFPQPAESDLAGWNLDGRLSRLTCSMEPNERIWTCLPLIHIFTFDKPVASRSLMPPALIYMVC